MQMTLAFLDPAQPTSSTDQMIPPPAAWERLDEAARLAALEMLATLIARMLVDAPTPETSND